MTVFSVWYISDYLKEAPTAILASVFVILILSAWTRTLHSSDILHVFPPQQSLFTMVKSPQRWQSDLPPV